MLPLALKMLVGDRAKFAGIIIGLGFASLLITQQLSIFLGFIVRSYVMITDNPAVDIWVMHPAVEFTEDSKKIEDGSLNTVRGVDGVAWAVPFYKGVHMARLDGGKLQPITLIGVDDATLVGGPTEMLKGRIEALRQGDAIVIDDLDLNGRLAKDYDGVAVPTKVGDTIELNDRRAVIVGTARVSRSFYWQPTIFTAYSRVGVYSPGARRLLTYVLVKVKPGQDAAEVAKRIEAATGLAAHTKGGFAKVTIDFVMKRTGIAINFGIAVLLGMFVGTAIAGQTFYNFTLDNLKTWAALKAMGASNRKLLGLIAAQALAAGGIGYGLGVGVAAGFGLLVRQSELAFWFPWQLMLVSAGAILLICVMSAMLSIRRVATLDPAVVFRS